MKWCILIAALMESAESFTNEWQEGYSYKEGDRIILFPGDDGILHVVDLQEAVDELFLNKYMRTPKNAYWLFTRTNPTKEHELVIEDLETIKSSSIHFKKDTVILAHGWFGHGRSEMNTILKEAFLQNNDVNVIVVDWSDLANKSYTTAKRGTPIVGKAVGEFIKWLVKLGASYEKMHLVGFSLGAHLVGSAGRETGAVVRRITALDPAGPWWKNDENRLTANDAQYVEVIHTNTLIVGYSGPCGDADFFPNGGSTMPGCGVLNPACSHSRSYQYMAASIVYDHFLANQCDSLKDMSKDMCNGTLNPMGNSDLNKSQSGIFRVNTGKEYPFKICTL